ncbi:maestro heat-like repeat-containing protein family member 1 [Stegostoma tigrinum]|uniref:maestro heat-like repeat-containing protein family member 1 n=1 Tax=Stegostoma tigrinum TaxID=3053191 RepID=UPI00287080C0|nr:maestro heat-like repeat-containing protein family member 1 [Stegostoma tigrinum]
MAVQTILTCHTSAAPGTAPGLDGAALAVVGSLARGGYLGLPGGEALVEFTVSLCARSGEEVRSWEAIEECGVPGRAGAGPMLEWLSLVEGSENILWGPLLQYVLVEDYTQALPTVCRCLERLALREPHRPGLGDGDQHGLPSPEGLLIRLLAVSSLPGGCAPDALRLLLALGPGLPAAAWRACQAEIPRILLALPGAWAGGQGRCWRRWEERLCLLFLLASGGDEAWAERMGQEAMRQAGRMACGAWERGFLLRGAGGLLKQTGSRELVRARLQEMLRVVRYQRAPEVEGLARGIGLCAARHQDEALGELARFAGSLLGQGGQGKGGEEEEAVRSGILLCYGRVAQGAAAQHLLLGLDAELLRPLLLLYLGGETPGPGGKAHGLGSGLRLVRALVWVSHLALGNGQLVCSPCPSKEELLCCLQELLGVQPLGGRTSSPLQHHALRACSLLIQLKPALGRESTFQLVRRCVGSVIGLRLSERPAGQILHALRGLLEQALLQDLTWEGLGSLLRALEGWTLSLEAQERERSLEMMAKLLAFYRERAGCQVGDGCPAGYRPEALLGRLLPRCLDPSGPVRLQALDCLLELFQLLGAGPMVAISLQRLGELWEKTGGPIHLGLCLELAKSLCQAVQGLGLRPLLAALCQGLRDSHPEGAGACAAVLHTVIWERGPELRVKGESGLMLLLRELWAHLRESRHPHIQLVALRSLALLARYHPEPALHFFLDCSHQPRPGEGQRLWAAMGWCPGLAVRLTELLLERLRAGLAQEEVDEDQQEEERNRRKESEALGQLLPHPGLGPSLPTIYPSSFATLLLLCSRQLLGLGSGKASPSDRAMSLLRALLTRGDRPEVASLMEEKGGWELLRSPGSYQRGVSLLADAMARGASPHLPAVLESLSSALDACRRGGQGPGRGGSPTMATVAAFFSQVAKYHPALGPGHADLLLSGLLHCLLDPSPSTRLLVLRGFGNVAAAPSAPPREMVGPTRRRRYTTKLLAALMSGMEGAAQAGQGREEEAQVMLEGLRAMSEVLAQSEGDGEGQGAPGDVLVNLCLGIRPLFEAQSAMVRASALSIFGALSRFAVGSCRLVYVEQLRSVLVGLLVYVNDSSPEVAQASVLLLASVRPLLGWDGLQMEQDSAHGYQAFLSQLSRSGLHQGPGYTQTYLSSGLRFCSHPLPQLRANAIAITGQLLRNMPKDSRYPLGDEEQLVYRTITSMLRDPAATVRLQAARTISLFFS